MTDYTIITHGKNMDIMKKQKILEELKKTTNDVWEDVEGVRALTRVTQDDKKVLTFNPASGVLVKVFVNQRTGEIKLYPAVMIEDAF